MPASAPFSQSNAKKRALRIVVVRNDKLGDCLLTLPSFAALRTTLPDAHITALVSPYTAEILHAVPFVDAVLIDTPDDTRALVRALRREYFDAAIVLFSTFRIGYCLFAAGIPYRLAPKTKLAQYWFNHTLLQRRSQSVAPEHKYNLDIVHHFLTTTNHTPQSVNPPFLRYDEDEVAALKKKFLQKHAISPENKLIFLHPGHGGSSANISPEQYGTLATHIVSNADHTFVVTAGPDEEALAEQVAAHITPKSCCVVQKLDLNTFAKHVQFADLFISGSTGTLHIAGALNKKTAAFYPRTRTAAATRWQSINDESKQLAFSPPSFADENAMHAIDMRTAAAHISRTFLMI